MVGANGAYRRVVNVSGGRNARRREKLIFGHFDEICCS